ncbi:Stp1/IreP family PP2C-type Ser/Thr phosphatase [Thermodesulfobacteriota bacterium]
MQVKASGLTDVGLQRDGNEDSFSTEDSLGLYIVADGMGGHKAGEVASGIAVEMINKSYRKWVDEEAYESELFGTPDSSLSIQGNYILSSIKLANRVVYEMAKEYDQYHGMGTTVVIVLVLPALIIAANVGDSRIYMVRDGEIETLSKDHTIVSEQVEMGLMTAEEAETSPLRHVLTRNLGSAENVEPDVFELDPSNNDRFILCSDGLTDLVSDQEIFEAMQKEENPEQLCQQLLQTVLKRGAHDNTTIVSINIAGMGKAKEGFVKKIGLSMADMVFGVQKTIKKLKP